METTVTRPPVQYLIEESGKRIGVVLSWADYQELCAARSGDPELLVGLSDAELEVLADGMLAPRLQKRLNHLLQLNRENALDSDTKQELDRLLEQVDQMNVLKARALYTLRCRRGMAEE